MLDYFLKLFAHEEWANAKLISALQALPQVPPRTLELVRHLFAAHDLWDKRFNGEEIKAFNAFPKLSLDECAEQNRIYGEKWRRYLKTLPEPLETQTVTFVGLDKKPHTYRVVDALTQLHAHSIHHRAQMMPDMRATGCEPVPTDYIRYCAGTEKKTN
jgi:uncharacterized damage-inducible protein DinB